MDVTLRERFVENLSRQLSSRKIKKSDLARDCGWHPARVSELLTCRDNPTLETVEKVEKALSLPPGALLLAPADISQESVGIPS
jgi:transcriptional regulator with XRE-family HTH domain